jgi:hypothetical protein
MAGEAVDFARHLPVGMLGNKTPRKAAATKAGREKVAEWLKYLEHDSARSQADLMATYDFGWLWRELKVEDLRRADPYRISMSQ